MNPFRPTAIPLITCDPFFSVWSFSDKLYDDKTRHWTGIAQSMFGVLFVDGKPFSFLGLKEWEDKNVSRVPTMEQTSVTVNPTTTIYTFRHPVCELKLTFFTPLLMDRLEVLSRPVSYIDYEITPKEDGHSFKVYFDVSAQLAGDMVDQDYIMEETKGHVWTGIADQTVLKRSGDDRRIEWGYVHLIHPNAYGAIAARHRIAILGLVPGVHEIKKTENKRYSCHHLPLLCAETEKLSDRFVVAYDDIHSVMYDHKPVDCYYQSVYGDFNTMLTVAVKEGDELKAACEKFDAELNAKMEKINAPYAKIGALLYRQAIAAHKLVSVNGELMFLSKENFSNGCMATLDVTYPSIPLFLLYNPELVRGMMRPLLAYARTAEWGNLPFAPHDCGRYPLCNGQVYGVEDGVVNEEQQMPVEECGNAILVLAAAFAMDGNRTLLEENRDLLSRWADYLVEFGYDPGNQLCTDDFAGHLAHNCNLSLKAIVALAAYAKLFGEEKYATVAKNMATRWVKDAKIEGGKGYRLTFTENDTWSMKYNIVWDRLLKLGLFDKSVFEEEVALYKAKMNRYGVPLDSRADYTKLDWMEWTTVMTDDDGYTLSVCESIARMIEESIDRVPVTDWYFTSTANERGFQARSVVGGFFINLLADKLLKKSFF